MASFEADQGLSSSYWNAPWDWMRPWPRPINRGDRRLSPSCKGGRRMRHPFLVPIIYPSLPDVTMNFGYDRLRRIPFTVTKTLDSSAVAKFPQKGEDVIISEIWRAEQLSTLTQLFHHFHAFWREILPVGRYIGWQPKDLTDRSYFVEILDVRLGQADPYPVEELGAKRPAYMREQLSVSFKLIREAQFPAAVAVMEGD